MIHAQQAYCTIDVHTRTMLMIRKAVHFRCQKSATHTVGTV